MKKNFPLITMALVATAFVAGVIYLFLLRFEAGDVYPAYSSLRADPLGTMALCESLQILPGLDVRRDVSSANKLPEEKNTTYLHLAAEVEDWQWMPADMFREIEGFLTGGGRLVITMYPVTGRDIWTTATVGTNTVTTNSPFAKFGPRKKSSAKKSKGKPIKTLEDQESLEKRWGVDFARVQLTQGVDGIYKPVQVTNRTDLPLPATLSWHSSLVLTNLSSAWHTIYERGSDAVVAERSFGRGTIILATDSYFLSNEAMWKAREPRLLAWLVGRPEHVIFDEAHLGVVESSGIAVLMRKYRLTGVIVALILLAGLFIWKNSLSLVPPHADIATGEFVTGKDAAGGFVNLLRRNISPREVLNVCFEQWTKSLLHHGNYRIASVESAQAEMEAEYARSTRARDPVRAYRAIATALKSPATAPDSARKNEPTL